MILLEACGRLRLRRMKKLRPSGGYRDTCSFQTATLICDSTVWFCADCKGLVKI